MPAVEQFLFVSFDLEVSPWATCFRMNIANNSRATFSEC